MMETLQTDLLSPEEAAGQAFLTTAPNGLRYATFGRLDAPNTTPAELARLAGAVPVGLVEGLGRYVYLFVPLALSGARLEGDESAPFAAADRTFIAPVYSAALAENSICHRNARVGDTEYVILSSRLHVDRFALAFEFCINVSHNFVDGAGAPPEFADLVWKQAIAGIKGETSIDAWEERAAALGQPVSETEKKETLPAFRAEMVDEKARSAYQASAFADALAIYLLSLTLDFDYADLREREYPLLSAPALAERLRAVSRLFPANAGYSFQILYRRKP
ncbi:MAG: hypothetical protein ACRYF4_09405 [Janthinobacterium lividum]